MGAGYCGGFGNTQGTERHKKNNAKRRTIADKKQPIFSKDGHVTLENVSSRREFFLGKSVAKIEWILHKFGYKTKRRPSKHSTSRAKIIIILNSSKERNISQIQISPGSKRHGNVPYVKISTTNLGKIKIIGAKKDNYKTDNKEKAILLFRRYDNE